MKPSLVAFSTVLALACEAEVQEQRTQPNGTQTSQSVDKEKCFNIVNGAITTDFPSVGMLLSLAEGGKLSLCTGTFIGHNTMVTAAHCIPEDDEIKPVFIEGHSFAARSYNEIQRLIATGVKPKKIIRGRTSEKDGKIQLKNSYKDIAVLLFPDDTAPEISPVTTSLPENDEVVTIVGFGITSLEESADSQGTNGFDAKKRYGLNRYIRSKSFEEQLPDLISLVGRVETETNDPSDQEDSLFSSGDSGGPIFVGDRIAGVASTGGAIGELKVFYGENSKYEAQTVHARLSSEFAESIFEKAKDAGADISTARQNTARVSEQDAEAVGSKLPDCT